MASLQFFYPRIIYSKFSTHRLASIGFLKIMSTGLTLQSTQNNDLLMYWWTLNSPKMMSFHLINVHSIKILIPLTNTNFKGITMIQIITIMVLSSPHLIFQPNELVLVMATLTYSLSHMRLNLILISPHFLMLLSFSLLSQI